MAEVTTALPEATEEKIVTQNGDKAFEFAPHNSHLEFFSKINPTTANSSYGEEHVVDRVALWNDVLLQNPVVAMKLLFYSRDPRGGAGVRSLFRDILAAASEDVMAMKFIQANLDKISEYGRWDDMKALLNTNLQDDALTIWGNAIKEGNALACKWAPRKGRLALSLKRLMECTWKEYRTLVVKGTNDGNGVIETHLCENMGKKLDDWKLETTPGVAFGRYAKTIEKRIPTKLQEFKDSGKKINTTTVAAHECFRMLNADADKELINQMFNDLPNIIPDDNVRIMPMVDVSGSMHTEVSGSILAIDAAMGLGMYLSSRLTDSFHKRLITFAGNPTVISWKDMEFCDGARSIQEQTGGDCYNTDFRKAMDAMLGYATALDVPQDRMPNCIMVFSDMQFDSSELSGKDVSTMEHAKTAWNEAGYDFPAFIYWNLAAYGGQPTTENDNVAFLSGFSPSIAKNAFEAMEIKDGKVSINPFDTLSKAIAKYTIRLPETEI